MATILDGKSIALIIKDEIREEVAAWKAGGHCPKLAVILVGEDPASQAYVSAKRKVCRDVGMEYEVFALEDMAEKAALEQRILTLIARLNEDVSVDGILIEMPLPKGLDKDKICAALDPDKDVDGMSPVNRSRILSGEDGLYPATPASCIEILTRSGIEISGKHVVIVGRGETVGKPLVFMLLRHNPTVTVCHSYTQDLASFTGQADIVIAAVGKPGLLRKSMVRREAVVVDAGITPTAEGLCGDVAFSEVAEWVSAISPVPGGVGSLTTALLLKNVLKGLKRRGA
ncbi:MAG: bifunctional 5,10-methylenetetrahydrofolate dehydrogenase/5,10-methenyltetrahydrofolate cyclohydrolase [Peptococcaceae bacterium]|nr:bifunctional 5,10-methylenetetrahydrofolate dehydrogenase/5,10-methenyltetrahydrofolate cyclohydrolase [Peptococcaceae bacterium]